MTTLPSDDRRPGRGLLLLVSAFVLLVGVGGYWMQGRPDALQGPPATEEAGNDGVSQEQINTMVESLAARLKQQPDDAKGWAMLGRSYLVMGRHAEAK